MKLIIESETNKKKGHIWELSFLIHDDDDDDIETHNILNKSNI